MKAIVFTGPSLSIDDARGELDAVYLPPAAQGDVYRAVLQNAEALAVGIVDGYFDRVPAVWHKEILWAMSEGVYVFGSASMGALRAVELAPFGMIGVGEVFRAFHEHELEDDDEVAVVHGPADSGYRALSDAMCNIRFTLDAAVDAGILEEDDARILERSAKGLPYYDRAYRRVLAIGREQGVHDEVLARLASWLPDGAVNQKRADALGMLRAMRALIDVDPGPCPVDYTFEHTNAWESSCRRSKSILRANRGHSVVGWELMEEIQLAGPSTYEDTLTSTLARVLALEHGTSGNDPGLEAVQYEFDRYRTRRGLDTGESLARWQEERGLTDSEDLLRVFTTQAKLNRAKAEFRSEVATLLTDQLQLAGDYAKWHERAIQKREILSRRYLESPTLGDAGLSESALWAWYFGSVLALEVPRDIDAYAIGAWFEDVPSFRTAVLREFCFQRIETGG